MNRYYRVLSTVILAVTASVVTCPSTQAADLEAGFRNPPAKTRPHAYWPWMNGNITREGITADLEAMARVGMGGGQIFNIAGASGCDIPAGPIDYFSDEWLDLVKHSASEAKRLGLEICLHNCAGWATSGGPWIKPENASQIVVSTEIKVAGGKRINRKLPLPGIRENYYRDIAVFAFPTPKNDKARLSRWTTGALYRACRTGRQPSLKPTSADAAIAPKTIVDISKHMRADGTLAWDAPAGSWTILRLGYTPTGNTNQPSPDSGRGLEIDKLSPEGLDIHWREGIQPVLDHLGPLVGKGLNNILIDSYEGGAANWTPRLREEFRKRRGYDPSGYLIALTGRIVGDGPTTSRFLWDFRRTVADLYADYYYGHFAKKCRDRGLLFSTEPYRGPFESLKVASHADIPMGEFWTNQIYAGSLKLASSAGHITGHPLIGAEAFTAGPGHGRWKMHPGSLRQIGDLAWTRGINRFIFHRFTHQPWLDRVPGMTMGQYGSHIDRTNTWWEQGRAWMKYIARSQFLLQQGDFVGDVLYFVGEASPAVGVSRKDIKAAGYDYDLCGTDVLAGLKLADGAVVVPSGKRYRLLVLPNTPFQTPALARKLRDLVRAGAAVLGPKPKYTPSLAGMGDSEKEVRSIAEEVWGKCDGAAVKSNRFGKGRIFAGISPAEALAMLKVVPDVKLPEDLAWIHRRTAGADIFLVSNQSGKAAETMAGFRVGPKQPELWDAEQGTISQAAGWTVSGRHARVPIRLLPGKSIFVVFRHPGKPQPDPYVKVEASGRKSPSWPARLDGSQGGRLRAWNNGPHTLVRASGKTRKIEVTGLPNPLTLAGPWDVRFQAKRGAPRQTRFGQLMSWSDHRDPGIRYFSGTATYSIHFEVPKGFVKPGQEVYLDLGDIAVIAEVRLNKKSLGILWHGPFRIEVSKALRVGTNTLEVDVTNLWVNRLIGDERLPADCQWTEAHLRGWPDWLTSGKPRPVPARITFTTWKHWSADDPLLPSGLIGPVSLRCARLVPLLTR